uniref:SF3 helicase domain-containing protein n=1 Tax=Hemiselmis andersenii TaxID=464988 RepID=A0A7S0U1F7_HEMAN|mmetsp:Transcript_32162/g.74818  ORF Transcript_32162/g.74818 Transcript_32162/m.74818 type:complete len:376 (+) Transcript_32162:1018-2145(+)
MLNYCSVITFDVMGGPIGVKLNWNFDRCTTTRATLVQFRQQTKNTQSFHPHIPNNHFFSYTQLWFGYNTTGETMLQLAVVFKGRGSNGKTVIGRVLERVLGSEIRRPIPCASLCKPDGVNNDPLFNARKARIVTVSEVDRGTDIKEKRFKEITGEEGEVFAKTMYGKEISFPPIFKTTFFVNDLPAIMESGKFCVGRRFAIVPMRVSFLNRNTKAGRQEAETLREMGQPEELLVDLDPGYFHKHVVGNEAAFLRFFVQGAQMFYASSTGNVSVPESLNEQAKASSRTAEAREGVQTFVEERLYVSRGSRVLTRTLYDAFKAFMGDEVDFLTFSIEDFGSELSRCLKCKGGEFTTVRKKQGSVQGFKARFWENLAM